MNAQRGASGGRSPARRAAMTKLRAGIERLGALSASPAPMETRRSAPQATNWRSRPGDRPGFKLGQQLIEDMAGAALQAQVAGKGPHRRAELEHVDIDVRPKRIRIRLHVGGKPRRFDVDQQAEIGVGQRVVGREAGKARTFV
ncbi:MAG: hypothetical protein ACLPSW_25815, partial [Roseiarcus sp.]